MAMDLKPGCPIAITEKHGPPRNVEHTTPVKHKQAFLIVKPRWIAFFAGFLPVFFPFLPFNAGFFPFLLVIFGDCMTPTIYHNPRCGTSRTTLALLQEKGIEPTVIEY